MKDQSKTKQALIQELASLRQRIAELERSEAECKQAEEALKESEERYRVLVEKASEGIYVAQDGMLKFINRAGVEIAGYSEQEIVSKPFIELIHPDDRAMVGERYLKRLKGEEFEFRYPFRVIAKNGDIKWLELGAALIDFEGRPATLNLVTDITKRKQMEDALHRSEENFRHSFDDSPMGVRIVTIEGETIYANRVILDIHGYDSIEELKTTPVEKRYTQESFAEHQIRREKRKRGDDAPSEYEISIVRKDSEVRHLLVLRREILWDGERQFQVIYQDITNRKRMEEELHVALEKYMVLFDAFPLGISITDAVGHIIETNRESERLLEISREEQISRNYVGPEWQIICPDGTPMPVHEYASVRAMKENCLVENVEMGIVKGDQEITWINVTAAPIPLKNFGVAIAYGDITDRKLAEEALRESEERYRSLFDNMLEGFAYCQMIFAEGQPQDLLYLGVNNAFEKLTGLKNVVGRKITEVIPGIKEANPELIEIYGRVALTRKPEKFEDYFEPLKAWLSISVYSPGKGYFVAVFDNITERKQAEEELRTSRLQLRALATRLQQIREEERIMIAREIHDEMGGGLTGLKMDLSWLLRKMSDADPCEERVALMDKIHTSNALIDQMIKVVRRISADLRPSVLDDLGLIAALSWQAQEFTSRTKIPCEFVTPIDYINLEDETATGVFRVFQEALTNVMRHSQATKVAVVLREDERSLFGEESLVLEIRDNGRGITEEEVLNPESLGLLGMKERVLAFGGELSIRGDPGGGTVLVLKIPRIQGEPS
jgi:PAS domain S-box-containing protein